MDFAAGQTLLFDKPKEWTSFDVVKKVRNIVRVKKVGHAGTLDPLATGLLILCTGKHTKQIESLQGQEKEYEVEFKLGSTTASYDAEQPEENFVDASHITEAEVRKAIESFVGEIVQTPPIFSALKVGGKRAYKAARSGKKIEMRKRQVTVSLFELNEFEQTDAVKARIICSKGTYIRSLVHDLGQLLGVGAHIRELRRTRIGEFRVEDAWQIEDFARTYKN